jgi:alanine-glyoxylate transaminase/serine-glyoxylate transaminase/serine-pyruvate transaminase
LAALSAAPRSHLDPDLLGLLDDIRARLARVFQAGDDALTLAVSGTGTSGLEAVVANLVEPGTRALAIVNGYFGDRLATVLGRYGAAVTRVESEWGRACELADVERHLASGRFQIVSVVHGETSTGVRNPVVDVARVARAHDALTIVDAVTSLGAVPVDVRGWQIDACYSCSQKGLGAPSGLAPVTFSARALERRVTCRSFYLDLRLLEDYWVHRKYHHTISAPLVYALHAALGEVEAEGLAPRWARHEAVHREFVRAMAEIGLSLLPPAPDRLWSLNTVRIPDGVDDLAVRRSLVEQHHIEIGGGLGPLAGRAWRVGLMGSGATLDNVRRLSTALAGVLEPAKS